MKILIKFCSLLKEMSNIHNSLHFIRLSCFGLPQVLPVIVIA